MKVNSRSPRWENKILIRIDNLIFHYLKNFIHKIYKIIFIYSSEKFPSGYLRNISNFLFQLFENIGVHFDIIVDYYIRLYDKLITEEIKMVNISPDDNILIIGCGAIPATAYLVGKKTNKKIVAIDHNREVIKKASRYINYHNLQNNILIEYGEGHQYNIKLFDKIFLVYGINNSEKILSNIFANGKKNIKLLCRLPAQKNKKNIFNKINSSFRYNIENIVSTHYLGPIDTYCLSKNNSNDNKF